MITITGKYNTAVCHCATLEPSAESQIKTVCDTSAFANCKIRIMPDVHAGRGCTIGTTMTLTDKVVPGMVGVDIGCGMEAVQLDERELDFDKLDRLIRGKIPCGREVRDTPHEYNSEIDMSVLRCAGEVNLSRARLSIGTLGGGNHFIEVDRDGDGSLWLVVHSGSRHLGTEVAEYYQNEGWRALCGNSKRQLSELIAKLKAEGREKEIASAKKALKSKKTADTDVPRELAYVDGELFDDYIADMKLTQKFAMLNRRAMTEVILRGMKLTQTDKFTTVHNYIDTESMILRKGAVSAKAGERLLIPINMRDGSLICLGRGNDDWNFSAPHGAGRLMSRHEASNTLSVSDYKAQMEGIYTTCVNRDTLDESPMAYKSLAEIESQLAPTAEIIGRLKPVYNFKASE